MTDVVLEMDRISKKFKKGEIHDSLRDLIPALSKKLGKGKYLELLGRNEFWALKDVSFCASRGEAFGIIGPNGAGKSTILKLLSGIMRPTEGTLRVNGILSALIEVGAGFHPDLTGRDNIFLNGTILGMRREQIRKKFDEIVEFSGLAEFLDTPVKRYSSGMYARLGFSVAAHVDPDIMLVDEVLSVGDYAFQNKCTEKIKSILRGGATVIFVSHNLKAVTDICERCVLLERGRILKQGTAKEVVGYYLNDTRAAGKEAFDGEVFISRAVLSSEDRETLQFEAGRKVWFEIEVTAKADCKNLSVSVAVSNDSLDEIFNTSTERLNGERFCLKKGETKRVTFELDLHLAQGAYYVGAYIYRYDIQKMYDTRLPGLPIFIRTDTDTRGVANLYPRATIE
jgi:lipopolysaccharide transport system ATP-binding protein